MPTHVMTLPKTILALLKYIQQLLEIKIAIIKIEKNKTIKSLSIIFLSDSDF